jgi:hypothetical protein
MFGSCHSKTTTVPELYNGEVTEGKACRYVSVIIFLMLLLSAVPSPFGAALRGGSVDSRPTTVTTPG